MCSAQIEEVKTNTRSSKWIAAAILLQIILAVYLQVVEWVPLGRWNNIANGNGQGQLDVLIAVVQLTILVVFWRQWRWLMAAGALAYAWWGWLEIQSWWIPYFWGASQQWMGVYDRWFRHTYRFLPAIGNHPIPDAEHTVLMALIISVVLTAIKATADLFLHRRLGA